VESLRSQWRVGDETSRLLLDVAAGRPPTHHPRLTGERLLLAQRHGLLGLLAHSSDPSLREPSTPHYLLRAARGRMMKAGLRRVLLSLSEADIPAAVLKGPYVASHYRNPALRTYGDIDLLVRRADLPRALAVISADPAVETIPPKRPRADKRDIPFHDASGEWLLDIHWDLFSYSQLRGCARRATAEAWHAASEEPHHELGPLWHLPTEAHLGFLCTHAILDHRFRLILFRDLAEMAGSPGGLEWDQIVSFAGRWRLRGLIYLAWLMAAHLVGAPVPAEVLAEVRPSNLPIRVLERLLPRADVVRFEGYRPHPINLATVLVHDDPSQRIVLAARAPFAAPGWWRRVSSR
jgi:hypothetical protein